MEYPEYLQLIFRLKHHNIHQNTWLIPVSFLYPLNLSVIRSVKDYHQIGIGDDIREVFRK